MARPAPKMRSENFDENIASARALVRGIVARSDPMHASGIARDPFGADAECRIAGLNVDYSGLRARAVALGTPLPGVIPVSLSGGVVMEKIEPEIAQLWRAWALEYDETLIDPAAEQHDAAARYWGWW